jgi:hypothetical protein
MAVILTTDKLPCDIEALEPGDVLEVSFLERQTHEKFGTAQYHYAVLGVRTQIESERRRIRRPVVVKSKKGALHICKSDEALQVARNRYRETTRKAKRTHAILCDGGTLALSADERRQHERLMFSNGARLVAIVKPIVELGEERPKPTSNERVREAVALFEEQNKL